MPTVELDVLGGFVCRLEDLGEGARLVDRTPLVAVAVGEQENLLDALSGRVAGGSDLVISDPKYLRVLIEGHDEGHGGKVNVRVPFTLLRAGMRLAALLPAAAHEPINRALKENGLEIDISRIKPENLEDLVTHLRELAVDVEGARGEKVRVYCE